MRQDKGLTLIEVLGTVIVLTVAILVVAQLLQNSAKSSVSTSATDRSVQIARTALEEIKYNFADPEVELFGQFLNLQLLRTSTPPIAASVLYYPNTADQKYSVQISSQQIANPNVTLQGKTHNLSLSFRRIVIVCTHMQTGKTYELEALVPY